MNVIISSIEPNFYLEEKILRDRNSEFFLFIIDDISIFPFWEFVFSKSTKMVVSSSLALVWLVPFHIVVRWQFATPLRLKLSDQQFCPTSFLVKIFHKLKVKMTPSC